MKERISNTEFEKISDDLIINYVRNSTPEIWHQMAMEWNWDNTSTFLNWLVDNPKTDKATILMIYWKSTPKYFKQFKDRNDILLKQPWAINDFDFIEKIEKNYVENFYESQKFWYNPKNDEQGYDWTSEYEDKPQLIEIPDMFFTELIGGKIQNPPNFIEGIPTEVYTKLEELYQKYQIKGD